MVSGPETIEHLLNKADIVVNGSRPWDITVHNPAVFKRVLAHGSLGLGESYMDGWWDCQQLDQFFYRLLSAGVDRVVKVSPDLIRSVLVAKLFNLQKKSRAFRIGQHHYDLGNDLYQAMLDRRMTYSCGYWHQATNLDQAQEAKLDLICRKLDLKPGQRVLDIGCGWGSFAKYAAEKYGVSVVGITVSQKQLVLAQELCAGLPIELRFQDYRSLNEQFDHIVSVGMFEHVGVKNYPAYFAVADRCLKPGGLFLLHTIGSAVTFNGSDPWVGRYIFPNSMLPSAQQIAAASEQHFVIEDFHNFGADYAPTLSAWYENFVAAWPRFQSHYDERFFRMWSYYLLSFVASFRTRRIHVWQVVLSRRGVPGGYRSIR